MTRNLCLLLSIALASVAAVPPNPACVPTARDDWSKSYTASLPGKYPDKKSCQVLFLGDSLTQNWLVPASHQYRGGLETWEKIYRPLDAANLGVIGDRVENLLWRITKGKQLDGFAPKVIVLLIGANNLHGSRTDSPEQIAEGAKLLLDTTREKLPGSKVLLLGLLPRFDSYNSEEYFRAQIAAVNQLLAKLGDGRDVLFLDLGKSFLNNGGGIKKELFRDGLHLTPEGYRVWADAMEPSLQTLLASKEANGLRLPSGTTIGGISSPQPGQYGQETAKIAAEILRRMTGGASGKGRLVVGTKLPEVPELAKMGHGYAVKVGQDDIYISGTNPYYVREGVFRFFERLGAKFYGRGLNNDREMSQVSTGKYPMEKSLTVNPGWSESPRFPWLDNRFEIGEPRNVKDVKFKGLHWHHCSDLLVPFSQHGKKHPEYYAFLPEGKRLYSDAPDSWQSGGIHLCMGNHDVRRIAADNVSKWMDAEPDKNFFTVNQGDGPNWCVCDKCASYGSCSDRLISFVNAVADKARETHPDKMLLTTAYMPPSEAPPERYVPADNVMVSFAVYCNGGAKSQFHPLTDPVNAVSFQHFQGWLKILKPGRLVMFEYPPVYPYPLYPNGTLRAVIDNLKYYADIPQVFSVMYCGFAPESFGALQRHVVGELLWNPKADADKLIDEFMASYYGAAAPEMRQYLDLLTDAIREKPHYNWCENYAPGLLDSGLAEKAYPILDRAAAKVVADKERLARVRFEKMCLLGVDLYERNPINGRQENLAVLAPKLQEYSRLLLEELTPDRIALGLGGGRSVDARKWLLDMSGLDVGTAKLAESKALEAFLEADDPAAFLEKHGKPEAAIPAGGAILEGPFLPMAHLDNLAAGNMVFADAGRRLFAGPAWIDNPHNLVLWLKGMDKSGGKARLTIKLNGKTAYSGPSGFKADSLTVRRLPAPRDLVKHGFNQIELLNESPALEGAGARILLKQVKYLY